MIQKHKNTFLYGMLLAVVTHFYAFSNMIINHDGVNAFFTGESAEHMLALGRFLLVPVLFLSDTPVLPAVIGIISSIALALSCCLLSELFEFETKPTRIIGSAVLITFPAAANTFCYQFTADAYFIAMLCACCAAYLMKEQGRKMLLPASALLFVACGIYQTYWCFGAALLFLILLKEMLKDHFTLKSIFLRGLCFLSPLILSLGGYVLVNKIVQSALRVEASGYQGLDRMGKLGGIKQIYWTARFAYVEYLKFFFKFGAMRPSRFLVAVNILLALFMLYLLLKLFFAQKRNWQESFVFFLFVLLCPGILNILSFISNNVLHAVMMYAFVLPYLIALFLSERAAMLFHNKKIFGVKLLILSCVSMIAYSGYLTTNKIYTRQQLNYEATSSYMTRLVLRMETSPDFDPDKPMCFINESCQPSEHIILFENPPAQWAVFDDLTGMVGVDEGTMIKNEKDIFDFMNGFMGLSYLRADDTFRESIMDSDIFAEMPCYPAEGFVREIDGNLVIKLPY